MEALLPPQRQPSLAASRLHRKPFLDGGDSRQTLRSSCRDHRHRKVGMRITQCILLTFPSHVILTDWRTLREATNDLYLISRSWRPAWTRPRTGGRSDTAWRTWRSASRRRSRRRGGGASCWCPGTTITGTSHVGRARLRIPEERKTASHWIEVHGRRFCPRWPIEP